jgi:hypothetical protein
MDRYTTMVALASIICGSVIITSIIASVTRMFSRRRDSGVNPTALARIDDRMARMEQAIDAMAVEMERVAEGQRFTTRLLSERQADRLPR